MIEIVEIVDHPHHGLLWGYKNIKTTKEIKDDGEMVW
jgi:hypothetical protein